MSRCLDDLLPTPVDAEQLTALAPLRESRDLLVLLDRWVERGWLRALDRAFVNFPKSAPLAATPCYCWQRPWPVISWAMVMSASIWSRPSPSLISPCRCRRRATHWPGLCCCPRNCSPA